MTTAKAPRPVPVHAPMEQFKAVDGCLQIGGQPLTQLAARVGQTPFYAYDRQLMSERVAALRATLPNEISLHYAMKANPMPAVVQHMAGLVDGLDVASGGELQVALDTGTDAKEISFAGPGKSERELRSAVAAGITVNLESADELERIAAAANELGLTANVAVRVNPSFELKNAGMKMGGAATQFGIDTEQVPAVLKRIAELKQNFRGFHIFSGSQNLKPEALIETHNHTFALATELSGYVDAAGLQAIPTLNIGGGFGIPYFPGEKHLDLSDVAANLQRLLQERNALLQKSEIVIELGRYLVAEAGIYVCLVIERKQSKGETFLVTDGGLHHHLAATGNFGQIIRKNYPVLIANKMGSTETEKSHVVGPLCTPLDLLGKGMELPSAEAGDLVVILQSGAYGFTASPHHFLSHPLPMQVLV